MKRTLSVLAVVVTAATMVFLGVASAQDRESTTQDNTTENVTTQRVVTRTFTNPQAIAVGAAGGANVAVPYPSAISVSGFPRRSRITDVNLTLNNFTFTNSTADVAVMLAKGQRNQGVMADVGAGFGVNNITFTIDDEAANPLPAAAQLTSTSYRPARYGGDWPSPAPSALSVFDKAGPEGTWQLFVVDDGFAANTGQFAGGWTLTIKANAPRR